MVDSASTSFPSLTVLGGDKAGARFVFEEAVDNVLVGSDPSCRFCLDVAGISPVHARIWIDDTGITIYDTNSPRGLFVNDDRVDAQVRLRNGDIIWLGPPGEEESVMLQCRIPGRAEAVPATVALPPSEARPAAPEVAPEDEPTMAASPSAVPIPPTLVSPPTPAPAQEFEEEMGDAESQETLITPPAAPAEPPHQPTPHPASAAPHPAPPAAPPHRPVGARPPHPPPRRPVVTRPAPRPAARRSSGGGAGKIIGIGLVAVVVLGAAAVGVYFFVLPRLTARVATAPTPAIATPLPMPVAPTPEAMLQMTPAPGETPMATPEPDEVVIPVAPATTPTPVPAAAVPTPTPPPTPTPRTRPTPTPAPPKDTGSEQRMRVAGLLSRANQAYGSNQYDAARGLYVEALALDPQNAEAREGRDQAEAAAFAWKRSFVPGRTRVRSGKGGRADLSGFESSDVKVAKAPDYSGIIEFQPSQARIKPGDAYKIVIVLTNDGKKDYRIASAKATLTVNGQAQDIPAAPPAGELGPRKSVTLTQTGGTWGNDVRSWRLEVTVETTRNDVFTNQLSWR